jgi:hypothetical protein
LREKQRLYGAINFIVRLCSAKSYNEGWEEVRDVGKL